MPEPIPSPGPLRVPETVGSIQLVPLPDEEWRVVDTVREEQEGLGLIGFIRRLDGVFEAARLGAPLERHYVTTLGEALSYLKQSR